jgi:mannose/fructose-specific phosphotransferase system component IIA
MIGLILVTHGRLAEEFVAATEHVVGNQRNIRAVSIGRTMISNSAGATSRPRSRPSTMAPG